MTEQPELELDTTPSPEIVPEKTASDDAAAQLSERLKAAEAAQKAAEANAEAERLQRIEAQKRAEQATQQAQRYQTEVHSHEFTIIDNALDSVTRQHDTAKRDYQLAMESGDYAKAADAQSFMSKAAAKMVQLEAAKGDFERRQPPAEGRIEAPRQQAAPSSVEELIRTSIGNGTISPKSGAWLLLHPECASDPSKKEAMLRGHHAALGSGIQPDTPEYFQMIEEKIGLRRPPTPVDDASESPMSSASRTVPVSAPVSREAPGTIERNPNKIKLTPEMQEAAKISGLTNEQYAAHLIALKSEGRIGRTTH